MRTIEEMREIWASEKCDILIKSVNSDIGNWILNAHRTQILSLYQVQNLIDALKKMDPREAQKEAE